MEEEFIEVVGDNEEVINEEEGDLDASNES